MTEKIDLPRRKVLGALGAVGIGSAAGGMGTSAFFSDTESFQDNSLTAGELDLKVDWTEHYSDWSDDEAKSIETVSMEPGDGLTGFPSTAPPSEQSVFVSDPQQFMDNTAIEAFPDVLDKANDYDALPEPVDDDICDLPADLDEELSDGRDGVLASDLRTKGTFPPSEAGNAQTTEPGDPLISISDVKPGDFGEVTFSFHICGNPGYVWLTGELQSASENGYTEPELDDPDESGDADGDGKDDRVELLDEIRAALWYDTGEDEIYGADFEDDEDGETVKDVGEGDNIYGTGETLIPLMGSLRSVLTQLEAVMFPLDAEPMSGESDSGGGGGGGSNITVPTVTNTDAADVFLSTEAPFNTQGARNLNCMDYEETLNATDNYDLDLVGSALEADALQQGTSPSTCANITIDSVDVSGGTITLSSTHPVQVVSIKGGQNGEKIYVWDGEENGTDYDSGVILDGVEFTTPTNDNNNLAGISNIDVCCPVGPPPTNGGGGGQETPGRQCFPNSTTAFVGFEWWLPVDHANEIQGDSVSFDIGFYTEQCRHNDGTDPDPQGS